MFTRSFQNSAFDFNRSYFYSFSFLCMLTFRDKNKVLFAENKLIKINQKNRNYFLSLQIFHVDKHEEHGQPEGQGENVQQYRAK